MSLFDGKSVLVLGAGGSFDVGMPLGRELWESVAQDSSVYLQKAVEKAHDIHELMDRRDPKLVAYMRVIQSLRFAGTPDLSLDKVAKSVSGDRVYLSVDEFILNHRSIAAPITALVAGNLFLKLYELRDGLWQRRRELLYPKLPNKKGNGHIDNWMVLFVGLCRRWLQFSQSPPCPLVVVNFNYDRVFETILREQWERSELACPNFESCFEFLYPYGSFSALPATHADAASFIERECGNLGFAGTGSDVADRIKTAVHEADRIFLVGFSCSPHNVEILGLSPEFRQKLVVGGRLRVQNFEHKDVRLQRYLENGLGLEPSLCEAGGADELAANGFFEH